jgi:hypothetical protein
VVRDPNRGIIDTGLVGTLAFLQSREQNPIFDKQA